VIGIVGYVVAGLVVGGVLAGVTRSEAG